MKKVSVIIPVYNTENFILACLNSLQEQTYEELEIIIVNDGSTDRSKEVVEAFKEKDNRIKLYNFSENRGVGAARNYGIQQSTGEYIYFLDSDDYIPPDTIHILQNHINDNDMIRGKIRTTYLSTSFAIVYHGIFNPKIYTTNRYNLIRNHSSLNFLFKKQFIKENNLEFSGNSKLYSDTQFMLAALSKVRHVPLINEAVYFKRYRPDPINNPSLTQSNEKIKIEQFLKMYNQLRGLFKDKYTNQFLDKQLLNFYRKDIVTYLRNSTKSIDSFYPTLREALLKIDQKTLRSYDVFFRREVNTIRKGNIKKYKRTKRRLTFLRDLREGIKSVHKFKLFLYEHLFRKLPVKDNLIFFESFLGRSYSDSPKNIYEYLVKSDKKYKMVWSFNSKKEIPGNAIQQKRFSLRYFYYLARAKYWVSNARMSNQITKRDETIYLQTWHGTPLKKLAGDQENVFMPGTNPVTYKRNFKKETEQWDYLVSPNAYSSQIFKRAFWFEKEMLEFGYPRNDVLYNKNNLKNIKELKQTMKIPKNKKVILYAPTWRDDEYYSRGNYKFTLQFDLDKMLSEFGDEYIIILRMHYLIASQLDISAYKGFVYDFSSYDDISELYLVSDILMTDYSSVFFDYANLKRPILFYTYDFEKYRDQLRGFYLDIETEVPGPLLMTTDDIIKSVKNIDEVNATYKDKYKRFYERFCQWDDGKATKNIVKQVFKQ